MEYLNRTENHDGSAIKRAISGKALFLSILIIGLGIVLMLRNLDLLDSEAQRIIFSWPTLIIAIGFINLGGRKSWFGFLLILFGGFFLTGMVYDLPFDFEKMFWPLLIILGGISILFVAFGKFRPRSFSKSSVNENRIEEIQIFGGSDRIIHADKFEGGEVINIFGGSKLDFRKSRMADGIHTLDLVTIFGGCALIVPDEWNVKVEVMSIFGGFADKRHHTSEDPSQKLLIKGIAIFGGGEVVAIRKRQSLRWI